MMGSHWLRQSDPLGALPPSGFARLPEGISEPEKLGTV